MSFRANEQEKTERTDKTRATYARRALSLMRAFQNDAGVDVGDHPAVLLEWLAERRQRWAPATWRQYRAALAASYEDLGHADMAAAIRAIDTRACRPRTARPVAERNTSARKLKRLGPEDRAALHDALAASGSRYAGLTWLFLEAGRLAGLRPGEWPTAYWETQFAHLYDNIWHSKADRLNITARGVLHYPAILGMSHKKAFATVSDHAPVYIVLGKGKVDTAPAKGFKTAQTTGAAATCIDINTASASQLDRLDHVGPVTAERIVAHRPYRSLDGLTKVSGLSSNYVTDIRRGGLTCAIN